MPTATSSHAWELYHRAKAAKESSDWSGVFSQLTELFELAAEDRQDPYLGNAVGWLIYYMGKHLLRLAPPDIATIIRLLTIAQGFTYQVDTQPSAYAMLLRLALRVRKDYAGFLSFMDWWDLANLQAADHIPYTPPQGNRLPALAEQALLGFGKHLLAGYTASGKVGEGGYSITEIERFLPELSPYIQLYPQHRFLPYLRAQLYLALGRPHEALKDLHPFVRTHQKQSWAWDWLGRTYFRLGETEAARACFAQGLSLGAPDSLTILTLERYARLCLDMGEHGAAKGLIERVIRIRQREWGKIPGRIGKLTETEWYKTSTPQALDERDIRKWAKQARIYLYADLPEELGVVTGVNVEKGRVWYRLDRARKGSMLLSKLEKVPEMGDCLQMRVLAREGKEEVWYEALHARISEEAPPGDLVKEAKGILTQPRGKSFGFVGREVFVPPELMEAWQDRMGCQVSVLAMASYDARKQRWGWRAIRKMP